MGLGHFLCVLLEYERLQLSTHSTYSPFENYMDLRVVGGVVVVFFESAQIQIKLIANCWHFFVRSFCFVSLVCSCVSVCIEFFFSNSIMYVCLSGIILVSDQTFVWMNAQNNICIHCNSVHFS